MKMDLARASLFTKAWTSLAVCFGLVALSGAMWGQVQRIPGHTPSNNSSLQGTVRDPQTKLGIPGVKISLLRAGVVVREKWTDAEGIFRLVDVAPGTYELKAEKEGFQTLELRGLHDQGS